MTAKRIPAGQRLRSDEMWMKDSDGRDSQDSYAKPDQTQARP